MRMLATAFCLCGEPAVGMVRDIDTPESNGLSVIDKQPTNVFVGASKDEQPRGLMGLPIHAVSISGDDYEFHSEGILPMNSGLFRNVPAMFSKRLDGTEILRREERLLNRPIGKVLVPQLLGEFHKLLQRIPFRVSEFHTYPYAHCWAVTHVFHDSPAMRRISPALVIQSAERAHFDLQPRAMAGEQLAVSNLVRPLHLLQSTGDIDNADDGRQRSYYRADRAPSRPISHFELSAQIILGAFGLALGFYYALNALKHVRPQRVGETVIKFGAGVLCCSLGLITCLIGVELVLR